MKSGLPLPPWLLDSLTPATARYYARAVQEEGRTVVLVQTPDRREEARVILDRNGAHRRTVPAPSGAV